MKGKRMAMLAVGIIAGAVLTTLAGTLIFGMDTGFGGAVLIFLTMAVSGGTGFLIGKQYQVQKFNEYAYRKGFQEGSSENTLIIRYKDGSYPRQRAERTIR